jgi:hypothetical protein
MILYHFLRVILAYFGRLFVSLLCIRQGKKNHILIILVEPNLPGPAFGAPNYRRQSPFVFGSNSLKPRMLKKFFCCRSSHRGNLQHSVQQVIDHRYLFRRRIDMIPLFLLGFRLEIHEYSLK